MTITAEMEKSQQVFQTLLSEFKGKLTSQGRMAYNSEEMELYVLHRAHEMCREKQINWEVFGRVMDEALCW